MLEDLLIFDLFLCLIGLEGKDLCLVSPILRHTLARIGCLICYIQFLLSDDTVLSYSSSGSSGPGIWVWRQMRSSFALGRLICYRCEGMADRTRRKLLGLIELGMLLRESIEFDMVLYVGVPRGTRRFMSHWCHTGTFSSLHCRFFLLLILLEQTINCDGLRGHVLDHIHYLGVVELVYDPLDISRVLLVHRLDYLVLDGLLFSLLAQLFWGFQTFNGALLDGVLLRDGMRGSFTF